MGDTAGVAPGYRALARLVEARAHERKRVRHRHPRFVGGFHNWSELIGAGGLVSRGVVIQRTRLYGEDRDVQRGFLAGCSYKKMNATAYVFNPDASKPTFVLALGVSF